MKTIVFATNNNHKLDEVSAIVPSHIKIISLADLGCKDEIPETAETIEGNAVQKARYIYQKFGYDCFADDTGLEVDELDGEPGVYSARYAGEDCNATANMQKLLFNLDGKTNRIARFRTVIALIMQDSEYVFEGTIQGTISQIPRGTNGFGYDPVFVPEGYKETFAELGNDIKNKISHRAKAVRKLSGFLAESKE